MLLLGCGTNTATGTGGGTDYPNTKTASGKIMHADGTPATFTEVLLLPQDYMAHESRRTTVPEATTTDSNGYYILHVPDSGVFSLNAVNILNRTRLFMRGITVEGVDADTLYLSAALLKPTGNVKVKLPDNVAGTSGVLYVPGTSSAVTISALDTTVVIDSLPAGILPQLLFSVGSGTAPSVVVSDSLRIVAGQTLLVAPSLGEPLLVLKLNTTQSGVYIPDTCYQFPFVLRLEEFGMALRQFGDNGAGVRLTKEDGTILRCEVEEWDVSSGRASVWVLLDTVFGNSTQQSIHLFCSSDTASAGRPFTGRSAWVGDVGISVGWSARYSGIFDTALGFGGVYHMAGNTEDATVNFLDGVPGLSVCSDVGILGEALRFNGDATVTIPFVFNAPQMVTLSAWILLDTPVVNDVAVISLGGALHVGISEGTIKGTYRNRSGTSDSVSYKALDGTTKVIDYGWHHIAYSYNGQERHHLLFFDGEKAAEGYGENDIVYGSDDVATVIGSSWTSGGRGFAGLIDEVRIDQAVRSPSWIRLCYVSQRHGITTLMKVVFQKEWVQ